MKLVSRTLVTWLSPDGQGELHARAKALELHEDGRVQGNRSDLRNRSTANEQGDVPEQGRGGGRDELERLEEGHRQARGAEEASIAVEAD